MQYLGPMVESLRLLGTVHAPGVVQYEVTDSDAWDEQVCSYCNGRQMVVVAAQLDGNYKITLEGTRWLRCVSCRRGAVVEGGVVYPAGKPFRTPLGLPAADAAIWEEARSCLGVGATVAAVMLCRKILFHVAVENGLPAKNEKDRAPSYAQAVRHLQDAGLVTKRMLPWVDRIKDVGNDANHEVTPISVDQALDVAAFTEQILVLAYELDALMNDPQRAENGVP